MIEKYIADLLNGTRSLSFFLSLSFSLSLSEIQDILVMCV